MDRLDARHDRRGDPRLRGALEQLEIIAVVEEHLSDRPGSAGIELALEVIDLDVPAGRLRMLFGISGDRDIEVSNLADAGNELGRAAIAVGMLHIGLAGAAWRVAPQCNDAMDAGGLVA